MRQGSLMLSANAVVGQRRANGIARRIIIAMALRNAPFHDGADTLAYPSSGFPARVPNGRQHIHHVAGVDIGYPLVHQWIRVGVQRGAPLFLTFPDCASSASGRPELAPTPLGRSAHRRRGDQAPGRCCVGS